MSFHAAWENNYEIYLREVLPMNKSALLLLLLIGLLVLSETTYGNWDGDRRRWTFDTQSEKQNVKDKVELQSSNTIYRSLYFAKQNQAATEALLKKLRKTDDVSEELQDLRDEYAKRDAEERVTIKQILTSSNLRKQVWGTSLVTVGHMITGINAVQVYMGQLFVLSGVESSLIPYFAIAATFVLTAANCIGAKLAVKIASRYLLIFGYLTEAISLVLLTITATTQHLATWISYISIVSAVCFNFGFAIGPGANTLTLVSESFPQSARSAAQSLACFLFWFCFTLVIVVWPYLQDAIGGYSYLVFATLAFMFAAHVYVAIPVTKHRTFLEIEESYKRLKLPCHRLRRRHRASQLTNIPV
ncbi:solute carrier family 2, facilitated glucose transporter member 5-like [Ciona intestinalis]